jgi:hypothetical protein
MAKSEILGSEFDTTWKVALELFFRPFLELCFPAAHALIDWNQPPVFLDTELQQIAAPRRRATPPGQADGRQVGARAPAQWP